MNRQAAGELGGLATRDGFAADYQRRTGRSWYAHITKGGQRRKRLNRKERRVGGPARAASRMDGEEEPITTRFY